MEYIRYYSTIILWASPFALSGIIRNYDGEFPSKIARTLFHPGRRAPQLIPPYPGRSGGSAPELMSPYPGRSAPCMPYGYCAPFMRLNTAARNNTSRKEPKNTRTEECKNRRIEEHKNEITQEPKITGRALHGLYLGSASHVCAIAQLVVTRNDECEKQRTQEPITSGLCVPCTPCMNSSTIRRHKNRRTQEPNNARFEELKNRRTRDPKNARTEERKNRRVLDFARMRPMNICTIG